MKKRTLFVLVVLVTMCFGMSLKASAQAACAPPWQIGIPITVGEVLSFGGHNWKAIQAETQTVDGWQPPNVPALWSDQGACSGGGGTPTQLLHQRQHQLRLPHPRQLRAAEVAIRPGVPVPHMPHQAPR